MKGKRLTDVRSQAGSLTAGWRATCECANADESQASILSMLRAVQGPCTLLGLPCGHGREARYLRAAFLEFTIYAGDINLDCVMFCCETFAMLPIASKVHLDEVVFPTQFDIIWCGSLLTHFDSQRVAALL